MQRIVDMSMHMCIFAYGTIYLPVNYHLSLNMYLCKVLLSSFLMPSPCGYLMRPHLFPHPPSHTGSSIHTGSWGCTARRNTDVRDPEPQELEVMCQGYTTGLESLKTRERTGTHRVSTYLMTHRDTDLSFPETL